MVKWLGIVVVVLVVFVAAVFAAGSMMPQNHTASRTARLSQPPESVWTLITDIPAFPSWRKDVAVTQQLPSRNGKVVWRETSRSRNALTYEAETAERPRHLVTRITDKGLPFGGSWDYVIVPDGSGSRITITEHGVFLDEYDDAGSREQGTRALLEQLASSLK